LPSFAESIFFFDPLVKNVSMHTPSLSQQRFQRIMTASGMAYSLVQIGILVYAGVVLLPLLGPPGASAAERYQGYAQNHSLFKVGNYLMGLPAPFFLLFLGGIYSYFRKVDESIKGILFAALLSGSALIMLWPTGAIVSLVGVDIAAAGGDPITGGAFDSVVPYSLGLSALPRAVFVLCISVLLLSKKWLAYGGFFIAFLSLAGNMVIASGTFLPFSLGSALLFHAWVFCCSWVMFRQSVKQRLSRETSSYPSSGYVQR
jgi:hypothetical protein